MTVAERLTARLGSQLAAGTDPATRDWWERYSKGTARFRGVPVAGRRTAVGTLWRDEDLPI